MAGPAPRPSPGRSDSGFASNGLARCLSASNGFDQLLHKSPVDLGRDPSWDPSAAPGHRVRGRHPLSRTTLPQYTPHQPTPLPLQCPPTSLDSRFTFEGIELKRGQTHEWVNIALLRLYFYRLTKVRRKFIGNTAYSIPLKRLEHYICTYAQPRQERSSPAGI